MSSLGSISPLVESVQVADGATLYYELHGPDPAEGPGLTVVLLHGWTLDRRLWHRQVADLPDRLDPPADDTAHTDQDADAGPVRLLALDLRGHGRSADTGAGSATLVRLADDLVAVLREVVPDDRVVLVGHSLGGMALVEYAHREPADFAARVVGVVLVNSSAEGALHTRYGLPPPLARVVRLMELGGTGVLARFGAWHHHRHLMPALHPAVRWLVFGHTVEREWIRLVADMVGSASLRSIGAYRPAIDVHRRIEALTAMRDIPVVLLVGSLDRLTPPACAESIAAVLPHAELRVLDHAGHMLPLERPDAVTDAIVEVCHRAR